MLLTDEEFELEPIIGWNCLTLSPMELSVEEVIAYSQSSPAAAGRFALLHQEVLKGRSTTPFSQRGYRLGKFSGCRFSAMTWRHTHCI